MVRQENYETAEWQPVTPGSLNGLAKQIRSKRRRKKVARVVVPVAAVILVASLLPFLAESSPESQPNYGGIACSEVRANLDSFMAKDLDQERMASITAHLKECPQCRQRMEAMLQVEVASADRRIPEFLALGSLDHSSLMAASLK